MSTSLPAVLQLSASCCDPPAAVAGVPLPITNPPGATALRYRIGTFTSFRRAMLDSLGRAIDADTTGTNPFVNWHEGTAGDYQTIFIELWAYLADLLTFYQERIVNEAYLPTATQRASLLRLAALIGYRPSPGAGAVALEAFTVDKGKSLTIAAGSRTGSKPAPGAPAVVFESAATMTALGDYSAIPLASVTPSAPNDQFNALAAQSATGGIPYNIVLQGTGTRLSAGDYVLIVENVTIVDPETDASATFVQATTLRQLTGVSVDPASKTTTITWFEESAGFSNVTLYALRVIAAPFGNNAPSWASLPPSLRFPSSPPLPGTLPFPQNWDDPTDPLSSLPSPGDPDSTLSLDSVQPQLVGTPENPGWVVLLTDTPSFPKISTAPQMTLPPGTSWLRTRSLYGAYKVVDARPTSKSAFAISGRVTRLTLDPTWYAIPSGTFPLRNTILLTGADPLTLVTALPGAASASGQQLILAGQYPKLRVGQTAIVQGTLYDPAAQQPTATARAEAVVINFVGSPDPVNNLTTVTLQAPLSGTYATVTTVLMANVVTATQGETVHDEVLGSGDGSAFQSFPLSKAPLTYVPANQSDGTEAVQSTLDVIVNGVSWEEVPSLFESPAAAQVYATEQDDSGVTTVLFGDGFSGARAPSGQNNIHARYRKGLGTSGNLPAGSIAQLIDSLPGLRSVTNPLPSSGGTDPARPDQIRTLAPSSGQSFGRAVSVADYATLALGYPGVSKASAAWIPFDATSTGTRTTPQPYVQLTVATNDQLPLAQQPAFTRGFRLYLDQRREANIAMRLRDYTPVPINLSATIDIKERYPRAATLASVQAALLPGLAPDGTPGFFAFDRLQFGQGLSLAAVYAAIQAIPGVRDATITAFRRLDQNSSSATVADSIVLAPTELITIGTDPNHPELGLLTITLGAGGFIDT